jgi:hypothetical protein
MGHREVAIRRLAPGPPVVEAPLLFFKLLFFFKLHFGVRSVR